MAYLTARRRRACPSRIAAKTPSHEQNACRTMDAIIGLKGNGKAQAPLQAPGEGTKKAPAPARTHIPKQQEYPGYIPSRRRSQRTARPRGNGGRRLAGDGRDNRLRQRRRCQEQEVQRWPKHRMFRRRRNPL